MIVILPPCRGSREAEKPNIVRRLIRILVLHLLVSVSPSPTMVFLWRRGGTGADGMSDKSAPPKR